METLRSLKENIDKLLSEHPEWENLPIIYSSDDEGNNYQKINNNLTPTQVHDIKEYNLEVVGMKGDENIAIEDINCICIN